MAITKYGILGPFNNKVGTVIGKKFRGLDVMTGLYEKKTTEPPSDGQLRHRARFGMLSTFLYSAADLVEPGFRKLVKAGQSEVNAAYRFNFPQAFVEGSTALENTEDTSVPTIDKDNYGISLNFPKLMYSRGLVEPPNCPSIALTAPNIIRFSWLLQTENMYSRYGDKASFLIYSVEKKRVIVQKGVALRGDLQYEYEMHHKLQGDTFHCYMSFNNAEGKLVGNSVYIGMV